VEEVRRLRSGEGEKFRDLRLRALADAPYAFASLHAEECDQPAAWWEDIARESEAGEQGAVFVAVAGDAWLGMAGGYVDEDEPGTGGVWGTWVAPEARGHGLGDRLVEAVVDWARDRGMSRVGLSVTERALPAAALYRRLGFVATGVENPLRSDPSITEVWMIREV
jgi:GNAT superfamily N-acetyltransferase